METAANILMYISYMLLLSAVLVIFAKTANSSDIFSPVGDSVEGLNRYKKGASIYISGSMITFFISLIFRILS